ncbi:unnamed protein product [Nesidiocoris tenuis]|uniref:DNA primase large subunit n=1 Tax=Nesidiocoris tenuis TaxID=355587 RepID=A0A6H5FYS6_9HEMI|nr:unnamed protein product [Nesidiocoris tenuis]CAA9995240.1 unnamed protein product [Nesidiocoris tenuis]
MAFLEQNKINFKRADEEQKRAAVKISNGRVTMGQEYSLIPFVCVADLVRARKVFLHKGVAYVANDDIISVLMATYRSNLSQALAYISRRLHILDNEPRLQILVRGAGKNSRDVDYTNFVNKDKIDIRQLDTLAEMSYPLCMRQLHQRLRSAHHLKHFGRQQYGLFLKGIGVSLEDALLFWRSEFTKGMDPDKFERSYAYNVRHMYGREGKRANYAPQNCMKIISAPFAPGQFHGCPFKTLDPPGLTKALQGNGLSVIAQHEVVDLAKKGHFQLACSAFFSHTHKGSEQILIGHPNQYFDESQRIFTGKIVKKEERKTASKPAVPAAPADKTAKTTGKTAEWEDMDIDFANVDM